MDAFDAFSGRMTVAEDPTGATFGVWQAGSHHGAQLANEPGTLNWNEFRTNELVRELTGAGWRRRRSRSGSGHEGHRAGGPAGQSAPKPG